MANTRREFVKSGALSLAVGTSSAGAAGEIPKRPLGKTGLQVSVIGLGGGRIGVLEDAEAAYDVIRRCYDLGVNYFDTAGSGAYGLSQARYGWALKGLRDKIILGSKTRHRTYAHAELDLRQSLGLLKTDYIDLYQVHNILADEDIDLLFGSRGVMEMIEKAKKDGKIRYVGVTSHADPQVLNKVISQYDFDTVLMSLSISDGASGEKSFEKQTLPLARQKDMGVIAMKTLGAGRLLAKKVTTLDEALRYVLSLPISTAIMGFDEAQQVEDDVRIARSAKPVQAGEMELLRRRAARFELAQLEPWKQPPESETGRPAYRAD
jgi:aryl-alcohol dehydrogenase-like predicted oxidoreductase